MKKCPFCAEEIRDQDLFCPFCGRSLKSSLPDNDMKKCPFCAEWIRKEAVVCRYCKRELISEIDNTKKSGIKSSICKKAEDLTLEDISQLISSWADSYGTWPQEVIEKIGDSVSPISKGYLAA